MSHFSFNADDFGASLDGNRAIKQAIHSGIINSVSMMTTMPYFEDAVRFLRKKPQISVGLHFNLTEKTEYIGIKKIAWSLLTGKLSLEKAEQELTAQYQTLKATGLKITHLNSHEHLHIYPPLYRLLHRFAKEQGIEIVRNFPFSFSQLQMIRTITPTFKQLFLWVGYGVNHAFLPAEYKSSNHFFFDLNWHNTFSDAFFRKLLRTLPANAEIVCHLSSQLTSHPLSPERYACFNFLTKPTTLKIWKDSSDE